MMGRPSRTRPETGRARGALLLEVMLALGIFVMAGGAILALVNRTLSGLERTRLVASAADLARSTMGRIEAGLGSPQTLDGPVKPWPESDSGRREEDLTENLYSGGGIAPPESGWEVEIQTDPSSFTGLTLVTVRAFKRAAPGAERVAAEYTLRQLVRLAGKGEDRAGEEDSLAEEARRGLNESRLGSPARTPGGAGTRGGGR